MSLHRDRTSVYKMGKYKNATKRGRGAQEHTSSTPSFWGGEPWDTAPNLAEEVSTQMGASPKVSFRFTQPHRLSPVCSLSPEVGQTCSRTPDDWMHYCIHARVTLREGGPTSTFPCMEWIIDSWHISGWSWRIDYQSCDPRTRGSYIFLWKMIE